MICLGSKNLKLPHSLKLGFTSRILANEEQCTFEEEESSSSGGHYIRWKLPIPFLETGRSSHDRLQPPLAHHHRRIGQAHGIRQLVNLLQFVHIDLPVQLQQMDLLSAQSNTIIEPHPSSPFTYQARGETKFSSFMLVERKESEFGGSLTWTHPSCQEREGSPGS
jgi:hypothetical protein